jgi:hypothetical protein|tara:strand:- start:59 stop:172 length:114 start_codon:yes stop_codon:yes gene_type:complete
MAPSSADASSQIFPFERFTIIIFLLSIAQRTEKLFFG